MATKLVGPVLHADPQSAGSAREWRALMPIDLDPDYVRFFDDFVGYDVFTGTPTNGKGWKVYVDTGCTISTAAGALGGEMVLTSDADDEGAAIQSPIAMALTSGKRSWFECRIKSSDADQHETFVGLSESIATNPEDVLTESNRVGFQVNDGNASILCKTELADTETSTDSGSDMADNTYVRLGFYYDGSSSVEFYVDRVKVATHTTNIPTAAMGIALYHLSGAAADSSTIDYVLYCAER